MHPEIDPSGTILTTDPEIRAVPTSTEHTLGHFYEMLAHSLSLARAVGGLAMSKNIIQTPAGEDYQSWGRAARYGGLAITDMLDGYFARKGRKLRQEDESKTRHLPAFIDQIPDKILNDSVGYAIAEQERKNGDPLYGNVVMLAIGVDSARNIAVTADRILGVTQGLETKAQKQGKIKAAMQYAVTTVALSPLSKNRSVKKLLGAGFIYTAKQSVTSGIDIHKSLTEQRQNRS